MFKIYSGGEYFYQWDLGQRLIVEDDSFVKVHFCNQTQDCALVSDIYEENGMRLANVPNVLLQNTKNIRVYGCIEDEGDICITKDMQVFRVIARGKPDDYTYVEEENIKTWEELDIRVTELENSIGSDSSELAGRVEKLEKYDKELEPRVEKLEKYDKEVEPRVTKLETDGATLEERVLILETTGGGGSGGGVGAAQDGGEIFNDYAYNKTLGEKTHAEGDHTIAGVKGFEVTAVDKSKRIFTLDSVEGLAVGDKYSYTSAYGSNHVLLGEITEIVTTTRKVTVNVFPTSVTSVEPDAYFYIPDKPTIGTTLIGEASHAEGDTTRAIGKASHAEGYRNTSAGDYSHTEGRNNIAGFIAHAEGDRNQALGDYSHAEGESNTVTGYSAHAEGGSNKASGEYSHAEGFSTRANNARAHSEGVLTAAEGRASHTEGDCSETYGYGSHAEGGLSKAFGDYAHAEGLRAEAWGKYSHAEGAETLVDTEALFAHAEGYRSRAYGQASHAEGYNTMAHGTGSHSEGINTQASGRAVHVEGEGCIAKADYSHAEGVGVKIGIRGVLQHVQGKYNIEDNKGEYAHIIGNGNDDKDRKNIHTVTWDGNAWYSGNIEAGGNFILKSPNGTHYKLVVDDNGNLSVTAI